MPHLIAVLDSAVARPSLWLTLLALMGVALLFARRRGARWLLLAVVVTQAALLIFPVDRWLGAPLEDWYPRLSASPSRVDGIIVLGGAQALLISRDHRTPGLNAEGERLTEFLALARRYPAARLAYSGGAERGGWRERDAAGLLFAQFGLLSRVTFEDRSRNTWENALFSRRLLAPEPGQTWILVTSANHMPRAMAAFRAAGWPQPVPDPVAYQTARFGWPISRGLGRRLAVLDNFTHEWIGLLAYRLTGRAR